MKIYILITAIFLGENVDGQYNESSISDDVHLDSYNQIMNSISSKSIYEITNKYKRLANSIQDKSVQLLKNIQTKEAKIQKRQQSFDSIKSNELFDGAKNKYLELQTIIKGPIDKTVVNPLLEYIPGFDSIQSMIKFLNQPNLNLQGITSDKLQQLQSLNSQLQSLQSRLQQANNIQSFIKEREATLKSAFANKDLSKALLGYNKEVVYYQQCLKEYKAILYDKRRLEEKLLVSARHLPAFQQFMQKNSYLAQLFKMPDNTNTPEALIGLQTRENVQSLITEKISGAVSVNAGQYLQQELGLVQQQTGILKDKLSKFGGENSDMTMPDFKPNNEHTKSFLQRLEYGLNIQSEKSRYLLPATSEIALTLGYKLSSTKVMGIGISYSLGWGTGLNDIHFSNEGIGFRSYADLKLKGSIWISGGFEYNYLQRFSDISNLKNIDVWQRSALMGLFKKYKAGKKEGNMQLLYDFLALRQVPAGQSLKFRIGYTL
jgi:hypothetical protein